MRAGRALAAALGTLGALTGCVYTFDNPVTTQDAGSITGTIVLDGGAPGQIVGTRIDLLWSDLSIELGQSGKFIFLDLPDGTYTLRYTVPPATPGGASVVGELLDLYLPFTSSGVPDTIALETISIGIPGTVEGTVTVDGGVAAGVVVGAFAQNGDAGAGDYEGYATTTDSTGHYSLVLPHGDHAIWASSATEAASIDIGLQPGGALSGQDLALTAPALSASQLTGYVVIDPDGAHAPASVVEPLLSDPFTVALNPACPTCQTRLSFGTAAPAQGVSAAQVAVTGIPAGVFYDVTCSLPSTSPPIPPVVLNGIPIIAGQSTTLRQIFLLTQTTLDANNALPLDGGTEMTVPDAGADGGAGTDAGPDAGLDAGTDAGPLDAGPSCGIPADAGTANWTLVGAVPDPANGTGNFADAIVPLPLPGGFHSLFFSDSALGVYEVDDTQGSFGSPVWLWDAGTIAGTLTGTSLGGGSQNFVAWGSLLNSAPVPVAERQINGGTWSQLPTSSLTDLATTGSVQLLATVYDPASGEPWLVEVTLTSDVELAPLVNSDPAPPSTALDFPDAGLFALGLAATACGNPADGGSAICLLSYSGNFDDTSYSAWLTLFDPATRSFSSSQVYPVPGFVGAQISAAAIATVGCGQLELALGVPADGGTTQYLSATINPGLAPTFTEDLVGINDPGLFSWRGSALLVNQDTASGVSLEDVAALGGPWAPPPLPPDAGFAPYVPQGYVDPSGAVYLGLVDVTANIGPSGPASSSELNLYRLSP